MDAQKELEKWKADFSVAKTPEEQAAHKKRFNAFCSLFRQKTKSICSSFSGWSQAICN